MTSTRRSAVIGGAIIWIIGSVQFFIAQLIAQLAWTTPYSLLHNYISDLGNTACRAVSITSPLYICSPLYKLMNVAFILLGVTLIVGTVLTRNVFSPTRLRAVGLILIGIAGIGPILVGLAPENVNTNVHVTGAAIQFIGGNIGLIMIGALLYQHYQAPWGLCSMIWGMIGLIALVLFMLCRLTNHSLGLGVGGWERVVVYPLPLWTIVMGFMLLAKRRQTGSIAQFAL